MESFVKNMVSVPKILTSRKFYHIKSGTESSESTVWIIEKYVDVSPMYYFLTSFRHSKNKVGT